jgi:hypothetical protein
MSEEKNIYAPREEFNRTTVVAFDVDMTLITEDRKPIYENIQLFQAFKRLGCDMVIWSGGGIDYATQNGLFRFDMMGAGKPEEGYGVRDFKSKFGGELVEQGRFLCVNNPLLYTVGKKAVSFYKNRLKSTKAA